MKKIIVTIFILLVGLGAYSYGKYGTIISPGKINVEESITQPSSAYIKPTQKPNIQSQKIDNQNIQSGTSGTSPASTVLVTSSIISPEVKVRKFSYAPFGYSIEYPENWGGIVDYRYKKQTLHTPDSTPKETVSITVVDKNFFNTPFATKWGMIGYDDTKKNITIDGNCVKPEPLFFSTNSVKAIRYGGSLMADPAYMDYAIQTTNGDIILIHREMNVSSSELQGDVIARSLKLLNGNTFLIPDCAE